MYQQTVKIKKLRDEFPFEQQPRLQDKFPFSRRSPAVGSGFLNTASIIYNTPVFPVPEPLFRLVYGNETFQSSMLSDVIIAGRGPFDIENITNSSTYTTSSWSINDGVTTLTGNNNNGFMIPQYSGSAILTFDITLTLYYKDVSASANMRIIAHPASIDFESTNVTSTTNIDEGESVLHVFQNTSLGAYDSMLWTSSNPAFVFDDPTFGTVNVTFSPGLNEPPVIVTLRLYVLNDVVGEVTKTLEYNVTPTIPVVSINGIEIDTISPFGTFDEGDVVPLAWTNTSPPPGNYDEIVWTYSGLDNVVFSEPIDPLSFVDPNDPNQHLKISTDYVVGYPAPQTITVTLALKWNGVIMNSVTLTTIFNNILPKAVASFNGNTSDFTETLNAPLYNNLPITLNNTSSGTYDSFTWTRVSGPNVIVPPTGTPASFNDLMQPTFENQNLVIRLDLIRRGQNVGSVTRTITLRATGQSKLMTNAFALFDYLPRPQALATTYEGIEVLVNTGVPAIEPTKFRIRLTDVAGTFTLPFNTSAPHMNFTIFQGQSSTGQIGGPTNNASMEMSLDSTLTNAGGSMFVANWFSTAYPLNENINFGGTANLLGNFHSVRATYSLLRLAPQQPANSINNFDAFTTTVSVMTNKTYITAYETYFSNTLLSNNAILNDTNYFGPTTGRYRALNENTIKVTFQLPIGTRYVALITGALLVNNEASPIWGYPGGGGYASMINITQYVDATGKVTFGKVQTTGQQGSIFGFYTFTNYPF